MSAPSGWIRAFAVAIAMVFSAGNALGAGKIEPGAYCRLPEKGEKPKCLEPAVDEYTEFFTALDEGEISEDDVSRVESAVASGGSEDEQFLAISSLSYGYYRLAQQAAVDPSVHPDVVARLERWNDLLARAYDRSAKDPEYRAAVHEAALDLKEHAPSVGLRCQNERGVTTECDSTEAVLRGFHAAGDEVGIRGALGHLIERIFGGSDS